MNKQWEVLHDCDTEDGKATCWFRVINHKKYGKYAWITETANADYAVEVIEDEMKILVTCKSLTSAKRWASMNLIKEELR